MDGYGNDTTATSDSSSSAGDIAASIAQIFSTGVTAYTDSQAIQRGYQINDPRYYQSGYPAGVGTSYTPTAQGAGVSVSASSNKTLMLVVVAGLALFLLMKR